MDEKLREEITNLQTILIAIDDKLDKIRKIQDHLKERITEIKKEEAW